MKAQVLKKIAPVETRPLELTEMPVLQPGPEEILVKVSVCGVCHTELDEIEGRLAPRLPVILGHEIIGTVEAQGKNSMLFKTGDRVGIAWIHSACGTCKFCVRGDENLCPEFISTGCDAHGGYAEYTVVPEKFAYAIPTRFTDAQAAPLLCAGAIGYRNLKLAGIKPGQSLGLFGFGASAHIVLQIAVYWNCPVYVFTRSAAHRAMAEKLGACWTGSADAMPPQKLDFAIDFTPVGETVPNALRILEKGGKLVMAVIRKRNLIPAMDYAALLWDEKEIKSVANITGRDVQEFLALADTIPVIPEVQEFTLAEANDVLIMLKEGNIQGASVLKMDW
jgi:propanol-preferring alcohol dehydrogenase